MLDKCSSWGFERVPNSDGMLPERLEFQILKLSRFGKQEKLNWPNSPLMLSTFYKFIQVMLPAELQVMPVHSQWSEGILASSLLMFHQPVLKRASLSNRMGDNTECCYKCISNNNNKANKMCGPCDHHWNGRSHFHVSP